MTPLPSTSSLRAVGYALLSQTVLLPLVVVDLHDRWLPAGDQATLQAPAMASGSGAMGSPPKPFASAHDPLADLLAQPRSPRPDTTGILLGGSPAGTGWRSSTVASPLAEAASLAGPGHSAALPMRGWTTAIARPTTAPSTSSPMQPSGSALLGGLISLDDLDAAAAPLLPLAQQTRLAGGDAMARLPVAWREPMRRALQDLPVPAPRISGPREGSGTTIQPARVVQVGSTRIAKATEVPLALHADGSVDILTRPDNPAVVEEIQEWSSRQTAPEAGSLTPAVVRLQPVVADPVAADPGPASPLPADASSDPPALMITANDILP